MIARQASKCKCPVGKYEHCRTSGKKERLQREISKLSIPLEVILKLEYSPQVRKYEELKDSFEPKGGYPFQSVKRLHRFLWTYAVTLPSEIPKH